MTVFKNYYYFYYFTNLVIQDCHFLWLLDARNMPKNIKKVYENTTKSKTKHPKRTKNSAKVSMFY